jgi:hypothetical protein
VFSLHIEKISTGRARICFLSDAFWLIVALTA